MSQDPTSDLTQLSADTLIGLYRSGAAALSLGAGAGSIMTTEAAVAKMMLCLKCVRGALLFSMHESRVRH